MNKVAIVVIAIVIIILLIIMGIAFSGTPANQSADATQRPYVPPASTPPPSKIPALGCYTDYGDNRVLPNNLGHMSFTDCQNAARSAGHTYYGIEYANENGLGECWAGNSFNENGQRASSCNGNLGGAWSIYVNKF